MIISVDDSSAQTLDEGGRLWSVVTQQSVCPDHANVVSFVNLTDGSTGARISRTQLARTTGGSIAVVGGLAFDQTRRMLYYTSLTRSCVGSVAGPAHGDGLIYRRPAGGGAVTALPDPGGPGGPGIGALDYDAEEDVLWVVSFTPVSGLSFFFKINAVSGAVLKTISVPAALTGTGVPQANDTLAIARPADLGGAKVLLTDAGGTLKVRMSDSESRARVTIESSLRLTFQEFLLKASSPRP
jgi:hypothetical protein